MRSWFWGGALLLSGCLGLTPPPHEPTSWGTTSCGVLRAGVALPDRGDGFVRARPGETTRFGTPTLIGALERAATEVAHHFAGSAPLRIGDLSAPIGGRHTRHASHRTGRDADVIFYSTDASGRSVPGRGWLPYGRFGYAIEREAPGDLFLFDQARNWHLVRTLLLDEEAGVQWIFVSRGVKSRLLRWAIDHEPAGEPLVRAAYALQQPENSQPHDDHFHVRVLCTAAEQSAGCRNVGPIWPWLRATREKAECRSGDPLDDPALLHALLDD